MNFDLNDKCPRQAYVSIDLETTGLNPNECQILEIGAVIDDGRDNVDSLPVFRAIVKHDQIKGEPYALQMHPKLLFAIAQIPAVQGVGTLADPEISPLDPVNCMRRPADVVPNFLNFLSVNGIDIKKGLQPAGKNFASFDKPFLEAGIPNWKKDVKIKHRTIDPGNLYWYPGEEYIPDTAECYRRAGMEPVVAHTAVEDALGVVKLVRRYRIDKCAFVKGYKTGSKFIEAFGKLQAALHPTLLVNMDDPEGMADSIIRYLKEGQPGDN